jgi:cytoskeleton protein RodZ
MSLSQADVATKLKLTVRQVEAMEAEDLTHLPGEIFLRGFVRNYARLVGINPDELIAPLDANTTVSATITAHSEGVALGGSGLKRWLVIPLALLAFFVLVVAGLYHWLRQGEAALVPDTAMEVVTPAPTAVQPPLPKPAEPAPTDVAMPVEPVSSAPAADKPPAPAPTMEVAKPLPLPSAEPPKEKVKEAKEADSDATEPRASGSHVLRFTASQDAWIQVVDGEGRRFSKLVRAGGSDSIAGKSPFKLVVGEAAQVGLTYDGRTIDLAPFIGQKVARLTLE